MPKNNHQQQQKRVFLVGRRHRSPAKRKRQQINLIQKRSYIETRIVKLPSVQYTHHYINKLTAQYQKKYVFTLCSLAPGCRRNLPIKLFCSAFLRGQKSVMLLTQLSEYIYMFVCFSTRIHTYMHTYIWLQHHAATTPKHGIGVLLLSNKQ